MPKNDYVQKHQDPLQLRTTRNGGRDPRGFTPICKEDQWLQQAIESQRGCLLRRRRRRHGNLQPPPLLAGDERAAKKSSGRGGEGTRARGDAISQVTGTSTLPAANRCI